MATKTKTPKDSIIEEDESEDLDVQKILNYHLKEVLELVNRSTVEPIKRRPEKAKQKMPKPSLRTKKSFGDTQVSLETEPCGYNFTPIQRKAPTIISSSSAKKIKKFCENSTMTDTEIKFQNKGETFVTKDEAGLLEDKKGTEFVTVEVQCNRSANNQCDEDLSTSPAKKKTAHFHMAEMSSPGVSSVKHRKCGSPKNRDYDEDKNEDEDDDDNNGDDDDDDDDDQDEDSDDDLEQDDYFTIYRTSMYRTSIIGPRESTSTSMKERHESSSIQTTPYDSSQTVKDVSDTTDSGSSTKTSTSEGDSSHTVFFTKMVDKYKAPIIPISLYPEDYTPDQRGKETEVLLARYNLLSKGRNRILCNSTTHSEKLIDNLYHRLAHFLQTRINKLRGKAKQNERVMKFRKSIDRQILQSPFLIPDPETGGIKLAQKVSKHDLDGHKKQKEIYITRPPLVAQSKPVDQQLYDIRRKTPFHMKNPMKATVCSRTDALTHTGSELKKFVKIQTRSQVHLEATDLLQESIDHQTTPVERPTTTSVSDMEGFRSSTSAKFMAKPLESEEKFLTVSQKAVPLTKDEILEILETPEMHRWENLYLAKPDFSLTDYIKYLQRKKSTREKYPMYHRRKSKYASGTRSKRKRRLSVAAECFMTPETDKV